MSSPVPATSVSSRRRPSSAIHHSPNPRTRYLLDAERVTLTELREANDFSTEEVAEISALAPGKSMHLGGGAAPLFTLTRLADDPNSEFPAEVASLVARIQNVGSEDDPFWTCLCGNNPSDAGFTACDAKGAQKANESNEPTPEWDGEHYRCNACGCAFRRSDLVVIAAKRSIPPYRPDFDEWSNAVRFALVERLFKALLESEADERLAAAARRLVGKVRFSGHEEALSDVRVLAVEVDSMSNRDRWSTAMTLCMRIVEDWVEEDIEVYLIDESFDELVNELVGLEVAGGAA